MLTSHLATLIYLLPLALAGGADTTHWGVPRILRQSASGEEKTACSEPGSLFVEVGGKTLCSSTKTREK